MSKSLIKLLDNALLPAALMVVGKFTGILITMQIFGINFVIKETPNNVFAFQTLLSSQDALLVTSYSDLIMFSILAIGFSICIVRAVFFHNSHVSLSLLTRLAHRNLLNMIQNSYEIYHTASIWLFFLWISCIMVASNALSHLIYNWVGIAVFVAAILLSIVFFQDVYREVEYLRQHPAKYLNKQS